MQYLQNKLTFFVFYGNIKEMCRLHMDMETISFALFNETKFPEISE